MFTTTGAVIVLISVCRLPSRPTVSLFLLAFYRMSDLLGAFAPCADYSASEDGGLAFIDNGSLVGETGKVGMWGDRPQTSAYNRDG